MALEIGTWESGVIREAFDELFFVCRYMRMLALVSGDVAYSSVAQQ